jgi:hypothetical protein
MLTAIIPQGEQAWFFKLVVRGEHIEELRKPFEEFIASVKLGAGDARPTWKLPAGWEEKPGDAIRAATIDVPAGDKKLPLTVSSLPLSGEWDDYVERNVERWLNQLQQPPLPAGKTATLARKTDTRSGEATVIELVGVMATASSNLPAGHPPVSPEAGAATAPAVTAGASPSVSNPPAKPGPADPSASEAAAQPKEFSYRAPTDWKPGALNSMRKAAFIVGEGDQQAEVTVMPFPAGGPMSDAAMQAERWAGQAGLQLSEAELEAAAQDVTIDGIQGTQFEFLGPEGDKASQGILAAMIRRGDQMWFFKMTGPRSLVERQRDAFDKFLQSVKFAGDAN